jgi:ankyrin repeat protein
MMKRRGHLPKNRLSIFLLIFGIVTACGQHESRDLFAESDALADSTQRLSEVESLQLEIQRGDEGAVLQRIDNGLSVNYRLNEGRTLLMEAARWGRLNLVRELLQRGADVTLKDSQGLGARDFAQNYPEILRLLPLELSIEKLAELFHLARTGEWRKLKTELDQGVDVNLVEPATGDTLLISAARVGARGVIGMLIRYPNCDLNRRALDGRTARGAAQAAGHAAVVRDLQARGAQE